MKLKWAKMGVLARRSIFFRAPHAVAIAFAAVAILMELTIGRSCAQTAPDIQFNIQLLKRGQALEKAAAARFLIEQWQNTVDPLIDELGTYTVGSTFSDRAADSSSLLSLIDVLRTIIINKKGAIQTFRLKGNRSRKAIANLIWGARSTSKELRVNSTYILANVVDNTTLCLVLRHVIDPTISPDGRVNLLQVVQVAANWAHKENVNSILQSVNLLKKNVVDRQDDFTFTLRLIDDIVRRASSSVNKDFELPDALNINGCKEFNLTSPIEE